MTESDKACPSCGAPNEEMAEYFKKQAEHRREQELLREKARLAEAQQKKKQVNKYAAAPKQKKQISVVLFL